MRAAAEFHDRVIDDPDAGPTCRLDDGEAVAPAKIPVAFAGHHLAGRLARLALEVALVAFDPFEPHCHGGANCRVRHHRRDGNPDVAVGGYTPR